MYTIIDLVKQFDSNYRNSQAITSQAILAVILFIGAWGSWMNDRVYLLTFSLIAIIALIVGFTAQVSIYYSLGLCVLTVILALSQAELIRRGYA